MVATESIKVSKETKNRLDDSKTHKRESYDESINKMIDKKSKRVAK